ncbi:pre-mRNA-splicing factor ISY1, putative [Entamoeba invadens IP1]|uniref:pre-mRNA-splicing factor ISY1, putative n=1 Tax=Entamoeba invadens IP1 TaxID=370355 RepID=UPI0002C3F111|nr:pre-mRNA-splicing factor ISY1, putative [Entamoeba invadens IP1]ELP93205.1 pre-mRNA-splicing factor ISY1, putative [Entamoeba invadens IP1]|eukprot:XP_004259976.1 pre-mRNA-splicing factor ISY1, putative [Entamoeba invadens IP1]
MARNQEKAQSMLNRWKLMQSGTFVDNRQTKPKAPNMCKTLQEAKFWRQMVVKDMTQKIGEIQNAGIGENTVRSKNIEINKLNKERCAYERKIIELGGVVASKKDERFEERFMYFGAAKLLPEAKSENSNLKEKTQLKEDLKLLGEEYYGMDEYETQELLEEERREEGNLKKKMNASYMEIE